jgi:hypothetical protein
MSRLETRESYRHTRLTLLGLLLDVKACVINIVW